MGRVFVLPYHKTELYKPPRTPEKSFDFLGIKVFNLARVFDMLTCLRD